MYLDDNKNFDVLIFVEMQSERILKRSAVHTYLFAGGGGRVECLHYIGRVSYIYLLFELIITFAWLLNHLGWRFCETLDNCGLPLYQCNTMQLSLQVGELFTSYPEL